MLSVRLVFSNFGVPAMRQSLSRSPAANQEMEREVSSANTRAHSLHLVPHFQTRCKTVHIYVGLHQVKKPSEALQDIDYGTFCSHLSITHTIKLKFFFLHFW